MREISEAGSGRYCLVSKQSVVKKKETAAACYFFQQNYYVQSERGLLFNNTQTQPRLKTKRPSPPPPVQPHHTPLRNYQPMEFNLYKVWLQTMSSPSFFLRDSKESKTRARVKMRVSLALLSLRTNGGLLVVQAGCRSQTLLLRSVHSLCLLVDLSVLKGFYPNGVNKADFAVQNMFSSQNRNDKPIITCKLPFISISDAQ